jgi:hypothetical protein
LNCSFEGFNRLDKGLGGKLSDKEAEYRSTDGVLSIIELKQHLESGITLQILEVGEASSS